MLRVILTSLICLQFCLDNIHSQSLPDLFAKAMSAYQQGMYSLAYEAFEEIEGDIYIEKDLRGSAGYYAAECLFELGQLDGALLAFEEYLEHFQNSSYREGALNRAGYIYFIQENYDKSRTKLLLLIKEFPRGTFYSEANYRIGESFIAEERYSEGERYFEFILETDKTNQYKTKALYSLGLINERLKNYKKAVSYYDQLLAYYSDDELASLAQMRIGICYFQMGEYENALLELTDPKISDLPESSLEESKFVLANIYYQLKDFDKANDSYQNLLQSGSFSGESRKLKYGLAWTKFHKKEYSEAFKIFDELTTILTDSVAPFALFWSGECKRYDGLNSEALEIFKKFIDLYPNHKFLPRVKLNVGIIYYEEGDMPRAERYLMMSMEETDESSKAKILTFLGELSFNKGDFTSAKERFRDVLEIKGINNEQKNNAQFGLGLVSYYLDDFDSSISALSDLASNDRAFERDKVQFVLAESYSARGNYNAALQHYNNVNPANQEYEKDVLYGKAYIFYNTKDYGNAALTLNKFINKYPKDEKSRDAKLRLADSYFGLKNYSQASSAYGELVSSKQGGAQNDYLYYQYGQSLFKSGKSDQAIKQLGILQDKFPRSKYNDDSQYLIGWIYFKNGNFSSALPNYRKLLSRYPNSPIVPITYYSIGDSYFNLGNYDSALVSYNLLIEKYPNTNYVFDALNGIQYCYLAKDQPEMAIGFIDQFLTKNPGSSYLDELMYKKGEIYYSVENYSLAQKSFQEFINNYPKNQLVSNAYYWAAKSSFNLGSTSEGIKNYKLLISSNLNSEFGPSAVLELGTYYSQQNQFDSAIATYSYAIENLKDSKHIAEILFYKASAEVAKGDTAIAYRSYAQLLSKYYNSIFADKSRIELGLLELKANNFENAESLFSQVGKERNDDLGAQAQYMYGLTLFNQQKITDAVSAFVRVRSVFPGYDEWYTKSLLRLGDCYVILENPANAKEMFSAVIKKHPGDDYGKEAKAKMGNL